MADVLASDVVQRAFEYLSVVQPGESIAGTTFETNGFAALNDFLDSLSTEGRTVFTKAFKAFALQFGISGYTFGIGGTFATTLRAQQAISWSASSGGFRSGGAILNFPDFQAQAVDPFGSSSVIPRIVGADESFPLINVRVFPTPSVTPGTIEIQYWTPIVKLASLLSNVSTDFPPGWAHMLATNLAVVLYPKYARLGGMPPEVAANAQSSKGALVMQNAGPQPVPAQ